MKKNILFILIFALSICISCSTYKATPMPFKAPSSYPNAVKIEGSEIAAKAYSDPKEASEAFGFDIRGTGMLPVQIIFDNQGSHSLEIDGSQTFLEDINGNMWTILSGKIANERASKYVEGKEMAKGAAYHGLLGATAGALIGAAVGIVTGENVAKAAGKGAVIGGAGGAVIGGGEKYGASEAKGSISDDLDEKSIQNKTIKPQSMSYGFVFFPGEGKSPKRLHLRLIETDTGKIFPVKLDF
ncbi:MAG: hypothetical protein HQK79_00660 [Desulfobacterales bacterium]|nr:hypothetical protein [Desulfobacterales bacterium]